MAQYFRLSFVRTVSTTKALREDLRAGCQEEGEWETSGRRPQVEHACEDAIPRIGTQLVVALFSHPLFLLTVTGEQSHSFQGPEWEYKSCPWEQVLWVIGSHWQIYLFCLHLCYQGPGRNSFPNVLWHVLVSLVPGNEAAFWSDWHCKYKYILYLNYLLGEAFILIKTVTILTYFKLKF